MLKAIISDATPLRYLIEIGATGLLTRLFSEVIITPQVQAELSQPQTPAVVKDWIHSAPSWLRTQAPAQMAADLPVDLGEKSAISLALETGVSRLIMDDWQARNVAVSKGLTVIGTLAVLALSAKKGWIDFDPAIGRLALTTFRLDDDIITKVKAGAGIK